MIESLKRIFLIPELKSKIIFTLLMLVVCRLGVFIPVPGINGELALSVFKQITGGGQNLFQLVDVFSGGAFSKMTITALSVVPYISATIIMQLLVAVFPALQRELKEMPEVGKRKISKWTRLFTVVLSTLQASLYARHALHLNLSYPGVIVPEILDFTLFGMPILFYLVVMLTMTTGTLLLMWIGEQITEKGIGNGMSLIIAIGILSSIPTAVGSVIQQLNLDSQEPGQLNLSSLLLLMAIFIFVIIATVLIIQGQRKIPLQYARRIVGRREVQGSGSSYIPLKVNYAGVVPVIFASSLLLFPATIGQFLGKESWIGALAGSLTPDTWLHTALYVLLIIFFTYFWTATQFHPDQIASDMKRNGAFIPGIKQGKPTQDYLESTMQRITFIGAIFLAIIAVFPTLIGKMLSIDPNIRAFFGGTSLLILVGVVLDTLQQIESHLLMHRYDGFLKKGRVRGKA
ncbi:MAG: secY [Chlamydiales bacterium]|jgi:preprotein translocase subunit SecY|nr:secY [Chlamydiales bacterium]